MNLNRLFIIFLLSTGCNISRNQQPMVLDPPETQLKAEDLDFKTVSKFVFIPSCVGCHKKGNSSGGVNLENYENVFKHVPQIKLEVAGGLMPPGKPLNQLQVQVLNKWIDAGAKEYAGNVPPQSPPVSPVNPPAPLPNLPVLPGPTPPEVTFAEVNEKVFKVSCTGCHSEDGRNMAGLNLESYPSIFAARLNIAAAVEEGRMPPADMGLILTAAQKNLLAQWLTQGARP